MNEERKHPEVVAYELRRTTGPVSVPQAVNRRVCLSMNSGRFRLSWSASSIGDNDFVALYASTSAPDSDYIGGAWDYASKGSFFDTAVPVQSGYQARYLIYSISGNYYSVARSPAFPNVVTHSVAVSYPRKPTAPEWSMLSGLFPSLPQSKVWVTGPGTPMSSPFPPAYNCIAWSLSLDDRWINPDSPLTAFQTQYQGWGQKSTTLLSPSADIDGWGTSVEMTHGSKNYTGVSVGVSGLWESKLGQNLRITHDRQGLQGTTYGQVLTSFIPGYSVTTMELRHMTHWDELREDEEAILQDRITAIPADQRARFEAAFAAWEATWFKGKLAFSNNTHDFAQSPEFVPLKAMGPSILPLVIAKMCDPNRFVALVLYDTLQSSPELLVRYSEGDPYRLEGEQARAQRTIRRWIATQGK